MAGADFLTIKITADRGLLLKFHAKEELSLGHPSNLGICKKLI